MDTENYMNEKSAFIAIVGRPNVGKSSILNRLLGTKLAIVSNKPQTTRTRIMGVWTEGETQLVFIDTPGLIKPKNSLGDYMVKSVTSSVADVDACLLVVEANTKISKADEELVHRFKDLGVPALLAINKIDLLQDKSVLRSRLRSSPRSTNLKLWCRSPRRTATAGTRCVRKLIALGGAGRTLLLGRYAHRPAGARHCVRNRARENSALYG